MFLEFLKLIRIRQWVKNFFVFTPLFFAGVFTDEAAIINSIIGFLCFSLTASAVYIMNDIKDVEFDRLHYKKKNRPIASGKITVIYAIIISFIFIFAAFFLQNYFLPINSVYPLITYLIINLFYIFFLKNISILDILLISSGFVLRVIYGAMIISVGASSWIIFTTFCLAMFLGFAKRFKEFSEENPEKTRVSLKYYSRDLLDRLLSISCGATIISYALYTVDVSKFLEKPEFIFTNFFVIFGVFRFLQIIYIENKGDDPTEILIKDKLFTLNIFLWLFSSIYILFLS